MPLVPGPASTIQLDGFPLAPDPPEFEALFNEQSKASAALDRMLAGHETDLNNLPVKAIADLDSWVPEIVAASNVALDIGLLDESGVMSDFIEAATLLDSLAPDAPEVPQIPLVRLAFQVPNFGPAPVIQPFAVPPPTPVVVTAPPTPVVVTPAPTPIYIPPHFPPAAPITEPVFTAPVTPGPPPPPPPALPPPATAEEAIRQGKPFFGLPY